MVGHFVAGNSFVSLCAAAFFACACASQGPKQAMGEEQL